MGGLIAATVKSFSPSTGWGFANIEGDPRDVFLCRAEFLGESRALTPMPGDVISIQSIRCTPDGRLRARGIDLQARSPERPSEHHSFYPQGAVWRGDHRNV